jgi:sulfonate transport system permease protein
MAWQSAQSWNGLTHSVNFCARSRSGILRWSVILPWLLPASILIVWQVTTQNGWLAVQILPPPALVVQTFSELIENGEIRDNILISLRRISVGMLIGAALGFAFGGLLGVSNTLERYFGPLFRGLSAIPSLGWLPIFMLIFGIDEILKYVIIAKACFVPIVLNTSEGIRNIALAYREVGRVLRLRRWTWIARLIAPAALPSIFTGVRLAISHAWIALVIVEMLAATEGVGYMMVWGRKLFQIDIVIVGIILIGAIGYAMDSALQAVGRRLRRWEPAHVQ